MAEHLLVWQPTQCVQALLLDFDLDEHHLSTFCMKLKCAQFYILVYMLILGVWV